MSEIKKILFSFCVVLFNLAGLHAQVTSVTGKIIDAETLEPLPFVNICFQRSSLGTISDIDGTFFLSSKNATDTLVISSLGYEMQKIHIQKFVKNTFNIQLKPASLAIAEVVIKPGENPAFEILRKINKNKKSNNPEKISTYQYKSYNKLRLDMNNIDETFKNQRILKDFEFVFDYMDSSEVFGKNYLPLLISESVSKYYYRKNPPLEREVIEAFKVSGIENNTIAQYSGKMYQKMNIYDNFIKFFEPGFVSPISDFGRMYYKYYLEDSSFIDDSWCYKISFKPKRKQERTFNGYFWVADTSFAIKQIQLRVSPDVNLNLLKDMIIIHEYNKINDTTWFLTSEDVLIDFNLAEKTYGFFARKTAEYDSIIVYQPIPEEVLGLTTDTYIKETKVDKDETFWQENRKSELTEEDRNVYHMVDSVKQVPMYKTIYGLSELFINHYYVWGYAELGPYYTLYSSNPIEGQRIRLGGRTSNKFSTKIMIGGHVAYGFKDEKVKYGANIDYMFNTNPRVTLSTSYYHDIRQLGKSENAFLEDNILTSILRRNPNSKLTMIDQYNLKLEKEWVHGFSNSFSIKYETIYPSGYIPFYEISLTQDTLSHMSITSAEFTLGVHFAYKEKFLWGKFERLSLGTRFPIFEADFTYAPKGVLESDYEYCKIVTRLSDKIETNPMGYFRYRITAGKVFGNPPYPYLELHDGNETYATDPVAFNMMNYYEFASNEYVSVFGEQHFQGFFLNRIPLIRKLELREVVVAKVLFGHLRSYDYNVMAFPEGLMELSAPYYEASAGIENILKFIRIDAVWRLAYLDNPNIQKFGIRFYMQFTF